MGRGRETIALHFCARPRGNRKLRYLVGYPPPTVAPLWRPTSPVFYPPSFARSRSYFSRWLVLLSRWRRRSLESQMQPAPARRRVKEVGGTGAAGQGGERSIARTCFRHRRILPTTYIPGHIAGVCTYVILSGGYVCVSRWVYVYGVSRTYLSRVNKPSVPDDRE